MSAPAVQQEQLLELLLQLKKTRPEEARTILSSQPQIAYALMTVMVNINAINVDVVQKTLSGALSVGSNASSVPVPSIAPAPVPVPASAPVLGLPYGQIPTQIPTQPSAMQQPVIQQPSIQPPPMQPPLAIPPHLAGQSNRGNTPPYGYGGTPPYPRGGTPTYGRGTPVHPSQPPVHPGQAAAYPQQGAPPQIQPPPPYGTPGQPSSFGAPPPQLPPALQDTLENIPEDQKTLIMRVLAMTPEEIQKLPPHERGSMIQLRQALGLPP